MAILSIFLSVFQISTKYCLTSKKVKYCLIVLTGTLPRYDRYYANTVSTMASSGFGPYHGQWHIDAPTKCIGAIPTLWVMMTALGLV
jgi:hypothetical protein